MLRTIITRLLKNTINIISLNGYGMTILDIIFNTIRNREICIDPENLKLKLVIPNSLSKWRAETFYTKEVETLEWIDSFQKESVFWDIGANIGLYSIYAGKKCNKVYSFEPSVLNLELLAKNIHLNNLSDLITANSPAALNRVYYCGNSGAEACETAMKMSYLNHLAMGNSSKTKFLGRLQSYHGSTLDTLSLTDRTYSE